MSRPYHNLTLAILGELSRKDSIPFAELHKNVAPDLPYKQFYNALFRMGTGDLIKKTDKQLGLIASITSEGKLLLQRKNPEKDGVWKLVIFDIPEKHKKVRNILRAKLKQLYFKKWQNSIWVSPYKLDAEIEQEFLELGKQFFIRLIKTQSINIEDDLKKIFN